MRPQGPGWLRGAADGQQPVFVTTGGARLQTMEDHDRRFCHRRPLTWGFSLVLPVLTPGSSWQECPA
jgi:hypothetical protein